MCVSDWGKKWGCEAAACIYKGEERSSPPGERAGLEPVGSTSAGAATLGCFLWLGPFCLAASRPGSPSNCADSKAGEAQTQHSLSSECSSPSPSTQKPSLDLSRHHVPDPGDLCARQGTSPPAVSAAPLQAPSFKPPGTKWSGGTPHPLASCPH